MKFYCAYVNDNEYKYFTYDMESRLYLQLLLLLLLANLSNSLDIKPSPQNIDFIIPDVDTRKESPWDFRSRREDMDETCFRVHPSARNIVKRFYAILPYFDKSHSNTEFLHKLRATVNQMSQGEDMLDREAAFYAAALTPIIFMQRYRDTWCLMERFHRALRLYSISHPTEKRASLKLLQNYRAVNQKIRAFLVNLPVFSAPAPTLHAATVHTVVESDREDEEMPDKRDIRFLKELVRNLG